MSSFGKTLIQIALRLYVVVFDHSQALIYLFHSWRMSQMG